MFRLKKLSGCKHVFDPVDFINIEKCLEPWSEVYFKERKRYKLLLADWRIICPCWKCGKVFHAHCGLSLPGRIKAKGEWRYVEVNDV